MAHESKAAASWRMVYPPPGIGCTTSRESSKDAKRFQAPSIGPSVPGVAEVFSEAPACYVPLFTLVRGRGILRSSHVRSSRKFGYEDPLGESRLWVKAGRRAVL